MNSRDDQIVALRSRNSNLDQSRLRIFEAQLRESYNQASIIDRIALVDESVDRTPSDFRVIGIGELRPVRQFNDPGYVWDMYCKQAGRAVALGEETHFFEVIQDTVPQVGVSTGVGFSGLDGHIDELRSHGFTPDVLLAPIAYMVKFLGEKSELMDWERGRPSLRSGASRLEVLWSAKGRSLNTFLVLDHRVGTWHVKLDPVSRGRLTVAIGEQLSPVHGVVWLAETVAKYEVRDLRGIRSFRPDVEPDEGYPIVR